MSSRTVFWKWAATGLVFAGFLVWAQSLAVDGVAGMLQVGETSALRPMVEAQLGDVPLADGPGHDGQIYYAIGIDLGGHEVGPLLDHAAYRYRRILSPLLASGFGLLEGTALLYGLVVVATLSMAVATAIVAVMANRSGRSPLWSLAVLLNPGVWLSVQFLTGDVTALALMLAGLWAFTASGRGSPVWFGLSTLAKDVFLVTPVTLGVPRRRWAIAAVPSIVLLAWMTFLTVRLGDGFASRGNLDWPFAGMITASANWAHLDIVEWVYLLFSMATVVLGVAFSIRRSWLRWPIAAWTALAIVSSNWVWDFGNNAARAFAPIGVLVALAIAQPEMTGSDVITTERTRAM